MKTWLVSLAVGALLVACGGDDGGATVVLDDGDTGSEVALTVGDRLDVELEANPSTGYRWETGPLPDGIALVGEDLDDPDGSLVGAPGTQVFVFDVTDPGGGILRFEYVRSFDDPVVAERVVEYVLTITE